MKITLNGAVLLTLALLVSCGPSQRGRTDALLTEVGAYLDERPDSALVVLRALSPRQLRGGAQRARAALLHSMALDKSYIDLKTDSILAPAVSWYERHGSPDEKMKTLYYLGRIQYNAKEYQQAIVTYTEALELTDKSSDFKYIGFVNQAIADTYSVTYQGRESFQYLDRAYESFILIPDSSMAKRTLYKKALSLGDEKRYEESETLFNALISDPGGVESLIPRIKSAYALQLLAQNIDNTDKSMTMFRESLEETGTLYSANQWAAFAYGLFKQGETEQSGQLFEQLTELYPEDGRVAIWRSRAKYEGREYEDAFTLFNRGIEQQDSILRIQLGHSTMLAQKQFFENKAAEKERIARRRALLMTMSSIVFLLISLLTIVLVRNRLLKNRHEHARLLRMIDTIRQQVLKIEQEQQDLLLKGREGIRWRSQFMSLFQEYFSMLGKICADYEEGKINRGDASDRAVLRRLDYIIQDFIGDGGKNENFTRMLDKHLDNIMSDFKRDFPGLHPQRYQLVGYIFAGLDLSTVSVLMGIDVDQLYSRKYRIKNQIMSSSISGKDRYLEFFH